MNSLTYWVKEVLGAPYPKYDKWWVKVIATCGYWPHDEECTIMVNTEEEALLVKSGYKFEQ